MARHHLMSGTVHHHVANRIFHCRCNLALCHFRTNKTARNTYLCKNWVSSVLTRCEEAKHMKATAKSKRPVDYPLLQSQEQLPRRLDEAPYNGGCILLVDKPSGWTSFDVCNYLKFRFRRRYGIEKIGHTGTLDPMATGLLVLCVGKATKMVEQLTGMNKSYVGTLRLGEGTESLDAETEICELQPWKHITRQHLLEATKALEGHIKQVPPMYSAIRIGKGERLYHLARQGKVVERKERNILIQKFETHFDVESEDHAESDNLQTQDVSFLVDCSKGTFIRVLAYDLGQSLGSTAHLVRLRRTLVGNFRIGDAWNLDDLSSQLENLGEDKQMITKISASKDN